MKIVELKIQNFKKIDNLVISFNTIDSGIVVIKGRNEAGKSTVFSAITDVIFSSDFSKTTIEKYKSWQSAELPEIELVFLHNGKMYSITKSYKDKKYFIRDIINRNVIEGDLVLPFIQEVIGSSNKDIFLNVAFIDKINNSFSKKSQEFLQGEIEKLSIDEPLDSINRIIKYLDNRVSQIELGLNHPSKNSGELKSLIDSRSVISEEYTKSVEVGKTTEISNKAIEELLKEKEGYVNELKKHQDNISNYEKRSGVLNSVNEVNEKLKLIENIKIKVEGYEKRLESINSSSKEILNLSQIPNGSLKDLLKQVTVSIENINRYMKEKEVLLIKKDEIIETAKNVPPKIEIKEIFPLSIAGIFLLFFLVLTLIFSYIFLIPFIIVLIVSIFLIYLKIFPIQRKTVEDNSLKKEVVKEDSDIAIIDEKIHDELKKYPGVQSLEEIYTMKTNLITMDIEIEQINKSINDVLDGMSLEKLNSDYSELIHKKIECDEKSKQLDSIPVVTDSDYMYSKKEAELLARDIESTDKDIAKERGKLDGLNSSTKASKSEEYKLKLDKLDKQIEEKNRELKINKYASSAIELTLKESSTSKIKVISENFSKYVNDFTSGKYSRIDLENLNNIKVFSDEKQSFIDIENLSSGTIDLLYISLRLSIIDSLLNANIPVFFDDTFLEIDDRRMENIKNILYKVKDTHQIIIFSHTNTFDTWGGSVFNL